MDIGTFHSCTGLSPYSRTAIANSATIETGTSLRNVFRKLPAPALSPRIEGTDTPKHHPPFVKASHLKLGIRRRTSMSFWATTTLNGPYTPVSRVHRHERLVGIPHLPWGTKPTAGMRLLPHRGRLLRRRSERCLLRRQLLHLHRPLGVRELSLS